MHINKHTAGMSLGLLFALAHFAWAVLVAFGWAKALLAGVMHLHFVSMQFGINPFSFKTALGLIVFTFFAGYVVGWVFAAIWNTLKE